MWLWCPPTVPLDGSHRFRHGIHFSIGFVIASANKIGFLWSSLLSFVSSSNWNGGGDWIRKLPVKQEMAPTPFSCIEAQEVRPNGIVPSNGLVNGLLSLPFACGPHIGAWERSSVVNNTVRGTFVKEHGTGRCASAGISSQQAFEVIENNGFQMNIRLSSAFQPLPNGTFASHDVA